MCSRGLHIFDLWHKECQCLLRHKLNRLLGFIFVLWHKDCHCLLQRNLTHLLGSIFDQWPPLCVPRLTHGCLVKLGLQCKCIPKKKTLTKIKNQ